MDSLYKLIWLWLILFLAFGCSKSNTIEISGSIDYTGSADIYIAKQPVHYKYSEKIRFPVNVTQNGTFILSVPVDSTQIVEFNINDTSYPIVAQPGSSLDIQIHRAQFPDSVIVNGYPEPWDTLFSDYWDQEQAFLRKISSQLPAFREGDSTDVITLYKERSQLARKYFQDTPLIDLYYKAMGEYLVKRLENITYRRDQPGFNPENERQEILNEAKNLNFFTYESLHAQRAGIRDFTNDFANTFGVEDSLEKEYGQDLISYDVKRLGYQTLDSARTSVLNHIEGRRAKAYAKVHLIAERIGEMPLEVATPSYNQFLNEYSDFPGYTSFLQSFYEEIKQVTPGQPAIPFSLPNKNGQIVQMKDFLGKYVLLDFWARWCIPCLDEFPHMNEIYNNYSRDQFEIVAISIEDDSLRWRQALQEFQNPWPQLYGGNSFQQETFRAYRGGGIPFYILVDPEGNIVRYNDARPSFNLPQILDSLITQP
jgi:thiol-disulfide isomerase/thioredoxin